MKSKLLVFVLGIVAGIAITFLTVLFVLPGQMFIVNESKLIFEETLSGIEKSVTENGWSIPHQYNLQATMQKNGFEVNPVRVFSLCNPKHAYAILSGDNQRMVSALMPFRVAVYERDGMTFVSMLNSGLFSRFLGNNISEVMILAVVACQSGKKEQTSEKDQPVAVELVETTINVGGMHCDMCVNSIEKGVNELEGISYVKANLEDSTAVVKFDASKTDMAQIEKAIEKRGYSIKKDS